MPTGKSCREFAFHERKGGCASLADRVEFCNGSLGPFNCWRCASIAGSLASVLLLTSVFLVAREAGSVVVVMSSARFVVFFPSITFPLLGEELGCVCPFWMGPGETKVFVDIGCKSCGVENRILQVFRAVSGVFMGSKFILLELLRTLQPCSRSSPFQGCCRRVSPDRSPSFFVQAAAQAHQDQRSSGSP